MISFIWKLDIYLELFRKNTKVNSLCISRAFACAFSRTKFLSENFISSSSVLKLFSEFQVYHFFQKRTFLKNLKRKILIIPLEILVT